MTGIASTVRLKKEAEAAVAKGMPWIFAGDMSESSEHLLVPPGSLVAIESAKGKRLGTGYLNPKSAIVCRVLTLSQETIDQAFFEAHFEKALAYREKKIGGCHYRLIHSEADGLPGLLVDRFGDILVVQAGTAGMELLMPLWQAALEKTIAPNTIILRNDTGAREMEGLKREVKVIKGDVPELADVIENGFIYLADLLRGQKTGWFYDQRDNRRMIASLAKGKTLLDVYSHSGGFGLLAAKAGATKVTLVDSSKLALELAKKTAMNNNLSGIEYLQGDAFETMEKLHREHKTFGIVLADPPAFVKSRKDVAAGMKGYEKVAYLAARLVAEGGYLFIASCSHHAGRSRFNQAVMAGVKKAGRAGEIIRETGAAADHPRHPLLPQSEYLKGLLVKIIAS